MASASKLNNDPNKKYWVLINYQDKHNGKELTPAFKGEADPVARLALIHNPDNDTRMFAYTDVCETEYPNSCASSIIDHFERQYFTQGRFSFVVVPKDITNLDANVSEFLSEQGLPKTHHFPAPDNVGHSYVRESIFQQRLKSGQFNYLY